MLDTMNRSGMRPSSRICDGAEILVPLLQHDPRLVKARIDQRRADRPHARRRHPHVGIDERQNPRAVVEGAGDHRRQVVLGGLLAAGGGGYPSFRRPATKFARERGW